MSLTDTDTAVKCSAALDTIGSRMRPTNSALSAGLLSTSPSMALTMNSAVTPTMTAVTTIMTIVVGRFICGTSSSSEALEELLLDEDECDEERSNAVASDAAVVSVAVVVAVADGSSLPLSTSGALRPGTRMRRRTRRALRFTRPGTAAISGPYGVDSDTSSSL